MPKQGRRVRPISEERLAEMIDEATTDAYSFSEQVSGFFTMLDDHLALPFSTSVLDVDVLVHGVDLTRADEVVAVCKRGRTVQRLPILDLPLPSPPPDGAEWIAAYRVWRCENE
jgi:hypothetical protein